METLEELQKKMDNNEDPVAQSAAAATLANFYFIFNQERSAVRKTLKEVTAALENATINPHGVDQGEKKRLEVLKLSLKARLEMLDKRMESFLNSQTAIDPPSAGQVQQVKDLSKSVAILTAKDAALEDALAALTAIVNDAFS